MYISRAGDEHPKRTVKTLTPGEVFEIKGQMGVVYVRAEMDPSVHVNKIGGNPNVPWCWVMECRSGRITAMDATTEVYTPHAKLIIGT